MAMAPSGHVSHPRVIVADASDASRVTLCSLIRESLGWVVVAEARDGLEAARIARQTPADVLMVDVGIGGAAIAELVEIFETAGRPAIVALIDFPHQHAMARCTSVLKGSPPDHLRRVIQEALGGTSPVADRVEPRPSEPAREPLAVKRTNQPVGLLQSLLGQEASETHEIDPEAVDDPRGTVPGDVVASATEPEARDDPDLSIPGR
ncbi:MAG: hypothetical protein ACYCV7_06495, partial [Acidimicrobiales bacterium]